MKDMKSSFSVMIRFFLYTGGLAVVGLFLFSLHMFGFAELQAGTAGRELVSVKIADTLYRCEAVRTPAAQKRGLSGRATFAPYDCMLFFMDTSAKHGFWMKDMRFPIDIIWIQDREIVDISARLPVPEPGKTLETYIPRKPANIVMEVPAGFAQENGLHWGQELEIEK